MNRSSKFIEKLRNSNYVERSMLDRDGCHFWRNSQKISHKFIQGYDGEIVHIGNLQLTINEATIREVMGLPNRGAKYFKGVGINKEMCQ